MCHTSIFTSEVQERVFSTPGAFIFYSVGHTFLHLVPFILGHPFLDLFKVIRDLMQGASFE